MSQPAQPPSPTGGLANGEVVAATARRPWDQRVVTIAIITLLVWLPLQTPLAILAFQYGHLEVTAARGILLAKDALVALLIVYLFLRYRRTVRFRWWDYLAIVYVVALGVYTILPWILGSRLPTAAVVASLREFLVPVELYALGRLAILGGADLRQISLWFLGTAAVTAAVTVVLFVFVPITFWSSTLDLVTFERLVQGIPTAQSLWDISLLGQFGVGDSATFPRAVGPFTHPVGTGHYFVLPLLLFVAAAFRSWNSGDRRMTLVATGLALLSAVAVITPISRGDWIAAGVGMLVVGAIYRKLPASLVALAAVGVFLLVVPPYSYSIRSAAAGNDSSVVGHTSAVEQGVKTVLQNPLGLGVGQGDDFGAALSRGAQQSPGATASPSGETGSDAILGGGADTSAGVGENMYLAVLVTVGPLGFLALLGWMLGLARTLVRRGGQSRLVEWMAIGTGAALVGFAVSALSASPLLRFTTSASFWLLAGLLVAARLREQREDPAVIGT